MTISPLTLDNCHLPLNFIEQSLHVHGFPVDILNELLTTYNRFPTAVPARAPVLTALFKQRSNPLYALESVLCAPLMHKNNPAWGIEGDQQWPILCEMFNHTIPHRVPDEVNGEPHHLHFKMLLTLLSNPLNNSLGQSLKDDVFSKWSEHRFNMLIQTCENWAESQIRLSSSIDVHIFSVLVKNLNKVGCPPAVVSSLALAVSHIPHLRTAIEHNCLPQIKPYLQKHWADLIVAYFDKGRHDAQPWDVLSFILKIEPNIQIDAFIERQCWEHCLMRLDGPLLKVDEYKKTPSCQNMIEICSRLSPLALQEVVYKHVDAIKKYPFHLTLSVERMCFFGLDVDSVLLNEKRLHWDGETPNVLARLQFLSLKEAVASPHKKSVYKRKKI